MDSRTAFVPFRRNLSTMTTYVIPRPLLTEEKNISGINRPEIYYLINEDDGNNIVQLYIGQTRNGIIRLDDHNCSKDFWNKAIIFLAESKTFTLDMISGLEKFAIIKAQESKRYKVENNVVPKYEIDEYDLAAVEKIYDEIQFIMATQDYKMNDAKSTITEADILYILHAMKLQLSGHMTAKNLICWKVRRLILISLHICKDTIVKGKNSYFNNPS